SKRPIVNRTMDGCRAWSDQPSHSYKYQDTRIAPRNSTPQREPISPAWMGRDLASFVRSYKSIAIVNKQAQLQPNGRAQDHLP
ncbi:hypothetical protein ACP3WT_26090, partial [Salmonella enterica]|uniref:hypothetical protein n=1 Tax=Salmonella enterica TaxID=28901 RepID=UPI003CF1C4E0